MNKSFENFKNQLIEYGLPVDDNKLNQFNRYYDLLIEWNEKMNLTAITEYEDVLMKHFLDSVSIIKAVDLNSVSSIIDIGTGAGFPGIPIKIMFPHISITLLDSLNKRINFLNEVIEQLELSNVNTIHGRAEDFARNIIYREQYDLCVSRAVANLSTLTELCLPFVKVGGSFISYKSDKSDEELTNATNAIGLLGGKLFDTVSFNVNDNGRTLINIEKIKCTSKKYPRKAGVPSKEPL